MKILLANDDGIFAPGLAAIYKQLVKLGDVTVVAPADARSGAGHSITFRTPLLTEEVDVNGLFKGYQVAGSPADCVKLAVMQLVQGPIDLVVSGMNDGANVGINVYYSGTVAAAMEAAFLGIPAVAVSLSRELPATASDFDAGAAYCARIIKQVLPLQPRDVININIPLLSKGKPKGVRVVPQSATGFDEHYSRQTDGLGRTEYQLVGDRHRVDDAPTDLNSIEDGFITVTALTPDMTNYPRTMKLERINWSLDGDTVEPQPPQAGADSAV